PDTVHRVNVMSVTLVSTKYRWFASSKAMSPSSPNSCCSNEAGVSPGMSTKFLPPSTETQSHDMLRVNVGEFGSGPTTSCQFSLWAVEKMSPYRSTTTPGSYPNPRFGVTFTGAPNETRVTAAGAAALGWRSPTTTAT